MLSKLESKPIHSVSPKEAGLPPPGKQDTILYLNPKDLKPHPLNHILYDIKEDKFIDLTISMKDYYKKYNYPNTDVITISPGYMIYAGHRRTKVCLNNNIPVIRCVMVDREFDPKCLEDPALKLKEMDFLREYNHPNTKRNESEWPVVLRQYDVYNKTQEKITGKFYTPKQRNHYCRDRIRAVSTDNFRMMVEIYEKNRKDLISKVTENELSIKKAYNEAMNIQPPVKELYDPDRKNWVEYFRDNPKLMERVVDYANDMFQQYLKINIAGRVIVEDKKHGHEKTPISGNLSHFYMSAISLVLEEQGFKSITPNEEQGLPDVRILDLCKPGYHPERIEIKVAGFNGHGSSTYISAGGGTGRMVPHTFLIVVYDRITKRQMVVMSDLTKEDWTEDKNKKATMGMNIWADNHLDNCVFFHGEGFIDSRNLFNMNLKKVVTYNEWLLARRKIVDLREEIKKWV